MLHGRPSMMLGAGKPRLRLNDTISLRDDRRCASKPRAKRAFKACAAAGPLPHLVRIVLEIIVGPLAFMGPECDFELAQGPLKACLTGRRQQEEIEAPNAYGCGAKRKRL
jgi:hypothetical protein